MIAGKLDRRVLIEVPVSTPDPIYGTPTITWRPLSMFGSPAAAVILWANILDVPPSRSVAVQQGLVEGRNQVRVTLRYRDDINAAMRITEMDAPQRVMRIVGGPAEVGRREWLELMCETTTS